MKPYGKVDNKTRRLLRRKIGSRSQRRACLNPKGHRYMKDKPTPRMALASAIGKLLAQR